MTEKQLQEEVRKAFLISAGRLANVLTPEEWEAMPDAEKKSLIAEGAAVFLKGHVEGAETGETAANEIFSAHVDARRGTQ